MATRPSSHQAELLALLESGLVIVDDKAGCVLRRQGTYVQTVRADTMTILIMEGWVERRDDEIGGDEQIWRISEAGREQLHPSQLSEPTPPPKVRARGPFQVIDGGKT